MIRRYKYKRCRKNLWGIWAVAGLMLLSTGCGMWQLKDDLAKLDRHRLISGTIICDVPLDVSLDVPVVVALWSRDNTSPGGYWLVRCGMTFSFLRDSGNYYLMAFADTNEDGRYQKSELAGIYDDGFILDMDSGQEYQDLKIKLLPPGEIKIPDDVKYASQEEKAQNFVLKESQLGRVTTMEDPIFSDENGSMGLWTPLSFINKIGIRIYFLEAYDPGKIPILFVHGSSGHPGVWKEIIKTLDRRKYQPWMVFYPSGMRLNGIGQVYANFLDELRLKYGYKKLYVVAHSMGGLVGRSMLQHYAKLKNRARIPVFVSLASPWAGHTAAEKGVQYAPSVVPAWYDMVPESPFLRSLSSLPLPGELKHYLIFAYQGEGSLFSSQENSDGTIPLKSQLEMQIQNQAERVIGIDSNHVGVLSDTATLDVLNRILAGVNPGGD